MHFCMTILLTIMEPEACLLCRKCVGEVWGGGVPSPLGWGGGVPSPLGVGFGEGAVQKIFEQAENDAVVSLA